MGTVLGAVAIGVGLLALASRNFRPLQCDRETPKEWLLRGQTVWPLLNGAALGFGATSRLGFWLWYAIPVGGVLMAQPAVGAAIWATYGLTRTASAGVIWYTQSLRPNHEPAHILDRRGAANTVTTVTTIVLGLAVFLVMGL